MVQLGLWISTNSSHGFVARSNFVFLTTQFQVCHGNTATFFIELRDETTIISVDGTTGIVVKCWVPSRRNIDRASVEDFQSHHAMLIEDDMFNSGVSKGNVILWKSRSALLPSLREVINVRTFTCPEKVFPSAHWRIPRRLPSESDSPNSSVCKVKQMRMGHTAISDLLC